MSTPYEKAALWHIKHSEGASWADVLEAHFQHGYVLSGPDRFVIGRRVSSDWTEDQLRDPWEVDTAGDAWHLWLCAGGMPAIAASIPYPLPWILTHRRGVLRRFRMDDIVAMAGSPAGE